MNVSENRGRFYPYRPNGQNGIAACVCLTKRRENPDGITRAAQLSAALRYARTVALHGAKRHLKNAAGISPANPYDETISYADRKAAFVQNEAL